MRLRALITLALIIVVGGLLVSAAWADYPDVAGSAAGSILADENPVPKIYSLSPDSANAGTIAVILSVWGEDFVPGSVVRWSDADRNTDFINSSLLRVTLVGADIATGGVFDVTVFNPPPGGGDSNALPFTVNNPVPWVRSLSPSSVVEGGSGPSLTVNGGGFVSTSSVLWSGEPRVTTFLSSNQLQAAITGADVLNAGRVAVAVANPAPRGGTSDSLTFTISHPRPTVQELDPSAAFSGGDAFTLAVRGSGFSSESVVRWNGADRTTTFVSTSELRALILASDIVTPGSATVTVFTPVPGGGTSGPIIFTIVHPRPTIKSLNPRWVRVGDTALTLTVSGDDFYPGAVVRWNNSPRQTTFVSNTQLQATITALDVSIPSIAQITVVNPAPSVGVSAPHRFRVYGRVIRTYLPIVVREKQH
jgi:hypothetical protein